MFGVVVRLACVLFVVVVVGAVAFVGDRGVVLDVPVVGLVRFDIAAPLGGLVGFPGCGAGCCSFVLLLVCQCCLCFAERFRVCRSFYFGNGICRGSVVALLSWGSQL